MKVKFLTHACLSENEKMLALGIEKNKDQNIEVKIYDIESL